MSAASKGKDPMESECLAKAAYRSIEQAIRVARKSADARGKPLRVYACPHCGQFHLTSVLDPKHAIKGAS